MMCNSLSKLSPCLETNSTHKIIPLGTSSKNDAQELMKVLKMSKEHKALTTSNLNMLQKHLKSILLSIKMVEDGIQGQVDQNEGKLQEIAASLEGLGSFEDNETITSLREKVTAAASKAEEEQTASKEALTRFQAQFKTRIILHLEVISY